MPVYNRRELIRTRVRRRFIGTLSGAFVAIVTGRFDPPSPDPGEDSGSPEALYFDGGTPNGASDAGSPDSGMFDAPTPSQA